MKLNWFSNLGCTYGLHTPGKLASLRRIEDPDVLAGCPSTKESQIPESEAFRQTRFIRLQSISDVFLSMCSFQGTVSTALASRASAVLLSEIYSEWR